MQTFLPYASFEKTAKILDYRRLGKQRVESRQILDAIYNHTRWESHPIVRMWRGYETALKLYSNIMIWEWIERGYRNTMDLLCIDAEILLPPWYGSEKLHASHRSNLLRKDYIYYSKFGWDEPNDLPYFWPR